MKKIILSALLATMLKVVFAQYNSTTPNQPAQTGTQQTSPQQVNPNQNQTTGQNTPSSTNQHMTQTGNDWDLYGSTIVENNAVPQTTSSAFSTQYPDRQDVKWYKYSKGYIASYPGENKMYQGTMYDQNGKMTGLVKQVQYSTLSSSVTRNIKKKYPDYSGQYVYVITSPTGKKSYVTKMKNDWSDFDENGVYIEKH